MAKATKKKTSDNSKIKNAIEETKEFLKNEIEEECISSIVSKKCFERYFTFNEEQCTLTPKNNPPLILFEGFINYILTSPKLKKYREKELGIYLPTKKENLSLIYNKLSHIDYMTLRENENFISNEILKLQLISDNLLFNEDNKNTIFYNLFSEKLLMEITKDFIFDFRETIVINKRTYNKNRKSEWEFLVNVFIFCLYVVRGIERPKKFSVKAVKEYWIKVAKSLEMFNDWNRGRNQRIHTIYSDNEIYLYLAFEKNVLHSATELFREIRMGIKHHIITRCTKLDYTKREITIDWESVRFCIANNIF